MKLDPSSQVKGVGVAVTDLGEESVGCVWMWNALW
jgi:hypothetical protein